VPETKAAPEAKAAAPVTAEAKSAGAKPAAAKPATAPTASPPPASPPASPPPAAAAPAAAPSAASRTATPAAAAPKPAEVKPAEPKPAPKPVHIPRERLAPDGDVHAILSADHRDPFGFLGLHALEPGGPLLVRAFLPQARAASLIDATTGAVIAPLEKLRDEGFFAGAVPGRSEWFPYRFRIATELGEMEVDDPYRFGAVLSELDAHLLAEGSHQKLYDKLGAHVTTVDGVAGTAFAVWAPHAGRVAVIGDFNGWDGRRHGMRLRHECGVWEIFLPGVDPGSLYKYEIKAPDGGKLSDKSDPVAFYSERSPGTASIVCDLEHYTWGDAAWMQARKTFVPRESPISIYQIHLGSWRRKPEEGHRWLSYQEMADEVVGYVKDLGFTHIQLLPIAEYEDEASLGFQPLAPFAPTSRWGRPEQLRLIVDRCHQAGIGVLIDWVANRFAEDVRGLASFDGTHLYEHPNPQQRYLPGTPGVLCWDYGRREVANFLVANALFWIDKYHLDGLRVPDVEKMLYLDYGRARGDWTPNRFGGHENLEAVAFLRRMNEEVYAANPGIFTVAEENSAWQRLSHPTFVGGMGFGFRWNTQWVNDTLRYLSRNPVHRKYYHEEVVRGLATAFQENYVLPLSHADVAFGRRSLLSKMPGDRWQRFANLRTYYALMYAHPGKKLLFMGDEFAQDREWNSDISLDWHLLGDHTHQGMLKLVRDLNALYRTTPALHELDCEAEGFAWIDANDSDQSVVTFLRQGKDGKGLVVFVCNFTPVVRPNYRVGVPVGGFYEERLNTDAEAYGGTNVGNSGGVEAHAEPMHGRPYSVVLKLPPFAAVILEHTPGPRRS